MHALPQNWSALASLVFILGLKHGFDADHLATIDGLTRFNARTNPRLSRQCGALFSIGHGMVVLLIALTVSAMAAKLHLPEWVDRITVWISIFFLVALGVVNLNAVLRTDPTRVVQPIGIKGRLFGRFQRTAKPLLIVLVGALFALTFDTMSQATLFALTARQYGGWEHALMLALVFMLGMLVTDGINGLWISHMIRSADQFALIASRVMGLAVSGISLLVAAFGIAKLLSPEVEDWSAGKELMFGIVLVMIVALSFIAAIRLTRRHAASQA